MENSQGSSGVTQQAAASALPANPRPARLEYRGTG